MERAAIEDAMIISADPLPIWPGQQRQGSEDVDKEGSEEAVDEEGSEEDVDEEGVRRTWTKEQRRGPKEQRTRGCHYV